MKHKILIITMLILILIPIKVGAASITSVDIASVPTEQEVGNSFYLPFYVNFSGIGDSVGETSGIWMVALLLDFDDSILEIDGFYSDFFDTEIYKDIENNKYYVFSIANSDGARNKCVDQFLVCSQKYSINIRFHVISNAKENVDIKLEEVDAAAFKIDKTLESYTTDNMEELEYTKEVVRNIKIKKTEKEIEVPKASVVTKEKIPEIKDNIIEESKKNLNSSSSNTSNFKNDKSSNNNLASLMIESYELNFKKDKQEYYITVDNDIHSLNITAKPEDEKATYQIIGADNLGEEIKITVKAESGEEKKLYYQNRQKSRNKKFY